MLDAAGQHTRAMLALRTTARSWRPDNRKSADYPSIRANGHACSTVQSIPLAANPPLRRSNYNIHSTGERLQIAVATVALVLKKRSIGARSYPRTRQIDCPKEAAILCLFLTSTAHERPAFVLLIRANGASRVKRLDHLVFQDCQGCLAAAGPLLILIADSDVAMVITDPAALVPHLVTSAHA